MKTKEMIKMQVEIKGERKRETASIILVGLLLGICFYFIIMPINFFWLEIKINSWIVVILSLIAGVSVMFLMFFVKKYSLAFFEGRRIKDRR